MRNEAAERKYYIDGNTVRRMEAAPAVTRPDQREPPGACHKRETGARETGAGTRD